MNKIALSLALCASLLMTTGCTSMSASDTRLDGRTAPVEFNSVVFTDYTLQRSWTEGLFGEGRRFRLSTENHGMRRSPTNTTEVFVVLRNHTDFDIVVEVQTQFFDMDGVPTDARPTWQRSTVPANGLHTYRQLSITTDPLQYRVEVREMRR